MIGRKKTRPSELIRALLKKNLPYRTVAACCNASHGSVWAEKKAMLKEEAEAAQKKLSEAPTISGGELFPNVKVEIPKNLKPEELAKLNEVLAAS